MLYQIVNSGKPIPINRAVKRAPSEKVESVFSFLRRKLISAYGNKKRKWARMIGAVLLRFVQLFTPSRIYWSGNAVEKGR